jgi:hypothetical protein
MVDQVPDRSDETTMPESLVASGRRAVHVVPPRFAGVASEVPAEAAAREGTQAVPAGTRGATTGPREVNPRRPHERPGRLLRQEDRPMLRMFEWKKPWYVTSAEHVAASMLAQTRKTLERPETELRALPHHVITRQVNRWSKCTFRYPIGVSTHVYQMWGSGLPLDHVPAMGDVEAPESARDWVVYLAETSFWPTRRGEGTKQRMLVHGPGLRSMGEQLPGSGVNVAGDHEAEEHVRASLGATLSHIEGGGKRLPGTSKDHLWGVASREWYLRALRS